MKYMYFEDISFVIFMSKKVYFYVIMFFYLSLYIRNNYPDILARLSVWWYVYIFIIFPYVGNICIDISAVCVNSYFVFIDIPIFAMICTTFFSTCKIYIIYFVCIYKCICACVLFTNAYKFMCDMCIYMILVHPNMTVIYSWSSSFIVIVCYAYTYVSMACNIFEGNNIFYQFSISSIFAFFCNTFSLYTYLRNTLFFVIMCINILTRNSKYICYMQCK